MTPFSARSTSSARSVSSAHPALKLLFGAVIAVIGVAGSMVLATLASDGSRADFSSPAHAAEMATQSDALFQVDAVPEIDAGSTAPVLAVSITEQPEPKRWTKRELIAWFRSWWRHHWSNRLPHRSTMSGATSDSPQKSRTETAPKAAPATTTETTLTDATVASSITAKTTTTASAGEQLAAPAPANADEEVQGKADTTVGAAPTEKTTAPTKPSPPDERSVPTKPSTSVETVAPEPSTAPTSNTAPEPTTSETAAPETSAAPTPTAPPSPPPQNPVSPNDDGIYRVTVGSGRSTEFYSDSPPEEVSAHGTRIYCVTSHFSHDDPIVFPGQSGAAHAHLFWGNTGADAFSTANSLINTGNSSCEGGTTNRSAYWMPALFNSANEAVIPESIFVYYKSFGGRGFDRSTVQEIPAGLEMLTNSDVRGWGEWAFDIGPHDGLLMAKIRFPECIAVNGNGQPVLSSDDNISHLSFAMGDSPSGCPGSHPYRIPTVSYIVQFDVPVNSAWYLSSDGSAATQGQSLHADYVAAWDDDAMAGLVDCTIQARRSCEFQGRAQLPERFQTPDGTEIYDYSVLLKPEADRTPFGTQITAYRR